MIWRDRPYFVKENTLDSTKCSLKLISSTCLSFWSTTYLLCLVSVFFNIQSMGTNCAPLLADLFLYSCAADFIQGLLKRNEKKLSQSFNFTLRYIDDVISLNNVMLSDFVDRIYFIGLEIKDTEEKIAECFQIRITSFPSIGRYRASLDICGSVDGTKNTHKYV